MTTQAEQTAVRTEDMSSAASCPAQAAPTWKWQGAPQCVPVCSPSCTYWR